MEHTYENVAALAGRAAGPLASYLGPFVTSLINQQYAASVIYIKMTHALAFDRWVAKRGVVLADLGDTHIERYQRRSRHRHQRIRPAGQTGCTQRSGHPAQSTGSAVRGGRVALYH